MEDTQSAQGSPPGYQVLESTHPFMQWLRTYLLWAQIMGIEPKVSVFPPNEEPSVENNLRWQEDNLWIRHDLLERVPPRLLAILAVRHYIEQKVQYRYLVPVILFVVLLLWITLAASGYILRLLGLAHLFVIPALVEVHMLLRELVRRQADDEAFERLNDPYTFLQAFQVALEESCRQGETDKHLERMLKRLNRLRAKVGEPPLTLDEVKQQAEKTPAEHREPQEETLATANKTQEEE